MRKTKNVLIPAAIVLIAAVFLFFLGRGDGPAYLSTSRGDFGASVLYDTLRHMGFPVGASHRPLTARTDLGDAYLIIAPRSPHVTMEMAEAMLEWVYGGGRLIFLDGGVSGRIMDSILTGPGDVREGFILYRHGSGEVLRGGARQVSNRSLANDPGPGRVIYETISDWDAERVRFGDFYHGAHAPETMLGGLPFIVQLVLLQLSFAAAAAIWHLGKRFGKPIPLYEEAEREENEYLRALARLYYKTGRKRRA